MLGRFGVRPASWTNLTAFAKHSWRDVNWFVCARFVSKKAWRTDLPAELEEQLLSSVNAAEPHPDNPLYGFTKPPVKVRRAIRKHRRAVAKREKFDELLVHGRLSSNRVNEAAIVYQNDGIRVVQPYHSWTFTRAKSEEVVQTRFFPVSNENLRKLVADERFKINDQLLTDVDYRFKAHDKFEFFTHFHEPLAFVSQEQMKNSVLVNDEHFLVVNKPASLVVYPIGKYRHNSVDHALARECDLRSLFSVHRLDRVASGVLLFAKTPDISARVQQTLVQRKAVKIYIARVTGSNLAIGETILIDAPLADAKFAALHSVDLVHGKPAQTIVYPFARHPSTNTTFVLAAPLTGRTHQIRIHLQHIGHAIDGDPSYGSVVPSDENHLWFVTADGYGKVLLPSESASSYDPLCHACQSETPNPRSRDAIARTLTASIPLHQLHFEMLCNDAALRRTFRSPAPEWASPLDQSVLQAAVETVRTAVIEHLNSGAAPAK